FRHAPPPVVYVWDRLYRHLLSLSLPLRSFHYSIDYNNSMKPYEVLQKMVDVCPQASELSFAPCEVTPTLLLELMAVHNNITVLELCVPDDYPHVRTTCKLNHHAKAMHLLHLYLCDSPNLVELKCIKTEILMDDLDIFDRARYIDLSWGPVRDLGAQTWPSRRYSEILLGLESDWNGQAWPSGRVEEKKRVWACRNLRTLELGVHAHGDIPMLWPVQSRILFGYISTVCPKLEVLDLKVPAQCAYGRKYRALSIHPQLEGGLCLLSKLEHLRILKIEHDAHEAHWVQSKCQKFDISWMTPSGLNRKKDKIRRREVVQQWDQDLETEQQLDAQFLDLSELEQQLGSRYEELKESLTTLGLLSDVKKVVEAMDLPGYRCLPSLER
ncbi:hypothetical protein BGX29_004636, partial [Mortierella sp. GBA35]